MFYEHSFSIFLYSPNCLSLDILMISFRLFPYELVFLLFVFVNVSLIGYELLLTQPYELLRMLAFYGHLLSLPNYGYVEETHLMHLSALNSIFSKAYQIYYDRLLEHELLLKDPLQQARGFQITFIQKFSLPKSGLLL